MTRSSLTHKIRVVFLASITLGIFAAPLFAFSPFSQDILDIVGEPGSFSPNGDGVQEQVFLSPYLKSDLEVVRWRLDILSKKGKLIRRTDGAGLPALFKWDGKNRKGVLVADGSYLARLHIEGKKFKANADSNPILVDNVSPVVTLSLSTGVFDASAVGSTNFTFLPKATDASPIDRWQIQVIDPSGRTVYLSAATGPVRELPWDGRDPTTGVVVPQGSYRCAFQAWDLAGNGSEPAFADLSVSVTPREMLEKLLRHIQVTESDLGLIVQLNGAGLFDFVKGKPRLRKEALPYLKETAVLINAYPAADVELNGYSQADKKAANDRGIGSLYAWRVYSYLVKDGHVKASRLKVRGRGRSPMFSRRAVKLPVVKEGVEIVLQGKDW